MDYVVEIKGVIRRQRGVVSVPAVVNIQIQIGPQELHRFVHNKDLKGKIKNRPKTRPAGVARLTCAKCSPIALFSNAHVTQYR